MLRQITSMRKNLLAGRIIAGNRNTSRGHELARKTTERDRSNIRESQRICRRVKEREREKANIKAQKLRLVVKGNSKIGQGTKAKHTKSKS